jgi:hypothetical protein
LVLPALKFSSVVDHVVRVDFAYPSVLRYARPVKKVFELAMVLAIDTGGAFPTARNAAMYCSASRT